ncbi:Calcium-activated chloride channel [Popillia japonica]|uniref:Anoctamin n=1 Tax=Popillia japonica TaxID=7064 RepID=A0AAW1MHG3_POPJA
MLCANNPHQIGRILFKEKRKRKRRSKENLSEGQPNVLQHIRPTKRRKTNTDSIANGPTTTTGGSTVPTTANLTQRGRRQLRKQDSFDKAVLDARLLARSCYFKDDPLKRIDFVLVTTSEICADVVKYTEIKNFLKALIDVGVQLEIEFGVTFSEYFFIKVNIPDSCVTHLANLYHIDLSCVNEHYSNPSKPIFKFLETELSKYEHSKLLERAPESIAGTKPSKATNAERSMLLQTLMKEIRYSDSPHEFGLESLLTKGLFIAAYPLHEGPYTWTRKGPLSDRQLLGAYWANFSMIFKAQPLNLIEKYFGTELGMYFAWIEFYVSYLIPASIVGILSFILGSVNTYLTDGTHDRNMRE